MSRAVIEVAALAKAMHAAAAIVESRNTIPILSNVRLVAKDQPPALEIITTDLDNEYRQTIPAVEAEPFATTVDARRLAALASAVDAGAQMSIEIESATRVIVKSGRSRWALPALPTDDFPVAPVPDVSAAITIEPAQRLTKVIDRVIWSASTEATRYYLGGPFLHADEGNVRLVTTNGATLVDARLDIPWPADAPEVILGAKFCRNLAKLADGAGAIRFSWDDKRARAEIGNIVLVGKVIEGAFPDYRRVIPSPQKAPILVELGTLAAAIRRTQLVATEKTKVIRIDVLDNLLEITVNDPTGGVAREEVPAECSKLPVPIGFQTSFVLNMLEAIGGETIEIHSQDAGSPALFRRVVSDGAQGVVMPFRV